MYRYRLERIRLADGTDFEPGRLTVVVGPNNSGKSRLLREVNEWCTQRNPGDLAVKQVICSLPQTSEEFEAFYKDHLVDQGQGALNIRPLKSDFSQRYTYPLNTRANLNQLVAYMMSSWDEIQRTSFSEIFGHIFVSYLTTENRLTMTKESRSSGNELEIGNILEAVWKGDFEVSDSIDQIVFDAFGIHIRLDVLTNPGSYLFRVGDRVQERVADEHQRRQILAACGRLDDQGDGVRSFVATVLALLVRRRPVLLIDEPEAFLHPPQAARLGTLIATEAQADRQVIVATHSTDVLRGILSVSPEAQIIRLTRDGTQARSQILDSTQVRDITLSPLLSSTRVLDGLFYRGVIVCEADADRAFYERVAARTLPDQDVFYTHAQSKQTLPSAARPLRDMGVRCALVADFDLLRVRHEFRFVLSALTNDSLDEVLRLRDSVSAAIDLVTPSDRLTAMRQMAESALAAIPAAVYAAEADTILTELEHRLDDAIDEGDIWKTAKRQGSNALPDPAKRDFDELDAWCRSHGLFIVPVGELESWMVPHGLPSPSSKKKGRWIARALEQLAEIPNLPHDSGVGRFVADIHAYLRADTLAPCPDGAAADSQA